MVYCKIIVIIKVATPAYSRVFAKESEKID